MDRLYLYYLFWIALLSVAIAFIHRNLLVLTTRQGFTGWAIGGLIISIGAWLLIRFYPILKKLYRDHAFSTYDYRACFCIVSIWLSVWALLAIYSIWLFAEPRAHTIVSTHYQISTHGKDSPVKITDYRLYINECPNVYRKSSRPLYFSIDHRSAEKLANSRQPVAITHRGRTFFSYRLLPGRSQKPTSCP